MTVFKCPSCNRIHESSINVALAICRGCGDIMKKMKPNPYLPKICGSGPVSARARAIQDNLATQETRLALKYTEKGGLEVLRLLYGEKGFQDKANNGFSFWGRH